MVGRLGVNYPQDPTEPSPRTHIPFIDSMQRLQAQKLPVIQAKGLELEHFSPLGLQLDHRGACAEPRRGAGGNWGGGGLVARPALAPTPRAQLGPAQAELLAAHASNTKSRTQKRRDLFMQLLRAASDCRCLWWPARFGAPQGDPEDKLRKPG